MNIQNLLDERVQLYKKVFLDADLIDRLRLTISTINGALHTGGKIIVCGNGGSAALADHFAAELVGRYKSDRRPLPCVSLTSNSTNTAIANDFEYRQVFSRQLEAFKQSTKDILVLFTTSGKSKNLLTAIDIANNLGILIIVFCGKDTSMLTFADMRVSVPSEDTALIQEVQQTLVHLVCEGIDEYWVENG
jgi:D-sedoheptulose 7-phosphate isomerase